MDICIIGGGASGIAAAISAKNEDKNLNICIIEKKDKLGSKLLATGNGRCNITNKSCINAGEVLCFLKKAGIYTAEEDEGRLYPITRQAKDVVSALTERLEIMNTYRETGAEVLSVKQRAIHDENHKSFIVEYKKNGEIKSLTAKHVLIATGGKAAPQFGTTGDGYKIAKSLGHSIEKLAPVLTPLNVENWQKSYKGIRLKAKLHLYRGMQKIAEEKGEVQFTEAGLSGICIFNLSRHVVISHEIAFQDYSISIDMLPEITEEEAKKILKAKARLPKLKVQSLLKSILPDEIAMDIINDKVSKDKQKTEAVNLSAEEINAVAEEIKQRTYKLKGAGGWKEAQCTRGGVSLKEINEKTMESKICCGLYFAGEVIDYDGPCGGYNLQNAWETGIRAGQSMAAKTKSKGKGNF